MRLNYDFCITLIEMRQNTFSNGYSNKPLVVLLVLYLQ